MIKKFTFAIVVLLFGLNLYAFESIYTGFFSNTAVNGYDPVAFFTEGRPVKGESAFKMMYNNKEWQFSSKENLEKFKNDPQRYAPQYGGYCGWRMAYDGEPISTDPAYWDIVKGKLYLSYDEDIMKKFKKNRKAFIDKANINWKKHGFTSLN